MERIGTKFLDSGRIVVIAIQERDGWRAYIKALDLTKGEQEVAEQVKNMTCGFHLNEQEARGMFPTIAGTYIA